MTGANYPGKPVSFPQGCCKEPLCKAPHSDNSHPCWLVPKEVALYSLDRRLSFDVFAGQLPFLNLSYKSSTVKDERGKAIQHSSKPSRVLVAKHVAVLIEKVGLAKV